MKYKVVRTETADAQIRKIILCVAENFVKEVALEKLEELEQNLLDLGLYPQKGVEPRYLVLKRQGYKVLMLKNRDAPVDSAVQEELEINEESVQNIPETIPKTEEPVETEETTEPETPVVQDDVGWTDTYSMILRHIPDHSLNTVSEVGLYGFDKEIYY